MFTNLRFSRNTFIWNREKEVLHHTSTGNPEYMKITLSKSATKTSGLKMLSSGG